MCGRYGRRADKQRIAEWFQTHDTNVFDDSSFAPSYNVAPQSLQPVVRLDSETGQRELTIMRWGLVLDSARSMPKLKRLRAAQRFVRHSSGGGAWFLPTCFMNG
jgi:putative SOS response-associated peptidase YedK